MYYAFNLSFAIYLCIHCQILLFATNHTALFWQALHEYLLHTYSPRLAEYIQSTHGLCPLFDQQKREFQGAQSSKKKRSLEAMRARGRPPLDSLWADRLALRVCVFISAASVHLL